MPTISEHLDGAAKNEKFAKSLDFSEPVQANWAITVIFYAALHYVDAFFVARVDRPVFHAQRERQIRDSAELSAIWVHYRRLKDMSREARYNLAPYTETEFEIALKNLEKVRSQVLVYLPT